MSEISVNIGKIIESVLPEAIMQCLEDACEDIANNAADNCPSDDGTLRGSITFRVTQEDNAYIGLIGTDVEYAPYIHEGTGLYAKEGKGRKNVPWTYRDAKGDYRSTKGIHPNPFLQEALDENMDNIMQRFEGALKDDT